jgi:4-amino-4-deoxy-L-arabinose transferase-like glycosyltransferase
VNGQGQGNEGWTAALVLGAVGALFSLPAMVLTLPLIALARVRRLAMWLVALVGAAVTAYLWSRIVGEMEAALEAIRRAGGFWEDPERAVEAAWPHVRAWWLMGLGLAPVGAVIVELFRPRTVEELRDRDERRTDRLRNRRERRARKAAGGPQA